ncbi:phage head-tail connector protein [Lysinibacillus capsici]|uniref:phage head-tail connector protein n=1 Tax=Lysinibacillus capsici TaxID=2115968 RepID=UPI0028AB499B|nr:phage head-tail connector protein [Lysinibacillus capsici]
MELTELKILLQLPESDTGNDAYLKMKLGEAIDWVIRVCGQSFLIDDVLMLPRVAKGVVAQYVAFELQGNHGIKSESIGGMSQTFDSASERDSALISKLSQARLRKARFTPYKRGFDHGPY